MVIVENQSTIPDEDWRLKIMKNGNDEDDEKWRCEEADNRD